MLLALCTLPAALPPKASDVTACVSCGGSTLCLESACKEGVCRRDQMVADGQAAGLSVDVPATCERRRLYKCEHVAARNLLRCLPLPSEAPAPAPAAAGASPGLASGSSSRPALPAGAAVALAAGSEPNPKPQTYPPKFMTGERAPNYFTVPALEQRKGITYDSLKKVEWKEGGQKAYFQPQIEFARNLNAEAARPENQGKAGYGLSSGQWMALLTLLYLNGDPAATKKMLLPLLVIASMPNWGLEASTGRASLDLPLTACGPRFGTVAPALMPALLPEREWPSYDRHFPKPLTRTDDNGRTNPEQGDWPKEGAPRGPRLLGPLELA